MTKVISVRIDDLLSDQLDERAKEHGMKVSQYIKDTLLRNIKDETLLSEYVKSESDKTMKLLKRIEAVTVAHLHHATVIATQDKSQFMTTLNRGKQVVKAMDEKEEGEA